MKNGKLIAKLLVALAAVAGTVFVIATYGEQIVAWCKKLLESCKCNGECQCEAAEEAAEEVVEAVEEAAEEAVEAVEEAVEEVVEEADFAN